MDIQCDISWPGQVRECDLPAVGHSVRLVFGHLLHRPHTRHDDLPNKSATWTIHAGAFRQVSAYRMGCRYRLKLGTHHDSSVDENHDISGNVVYIMGGTL